MTKERSHPDTDGVTDPLVSRTYRESASERVPDALDRAVLQQAKQNASKPYSRSIIWLRPMAWAATIGLSLAIVIELANLPQPDPALLAPPREETRVDLNRALTPQSREAAAPQRFEHEATEPRARKSIDDQGRVNLLNAPTLGKTEAPNSTPESTLEQVPESAPEPGRASGLASDADLFRLQDARVLEVAEELARSPEDKSKELDAGSAAYFASPATAARVSMPCVAEIRETPETWLECIVKLEDAGLDELASEQREQLLEAFPDFEFP